MKTNTWEENETILSEEIEGDVHIAFSVSPRDGSLEYYPLKRVAKYGRVKFIRKHDDSWGEGSDYESEIMTDPTWLDAAKAANDSVEIVGDHHHIFLEGLRPAGSVDAARIFELDMGS